MRLRYVLSTDLPQATSITTQNLTESRVVILQFEYSGVRIRLPILLDSGCGQVTYTRYGQKISVCFYSCAGLMVRMELARVIINEQSQSQVIFLREVNGSRMFPIVIGIFEAAAIDQKLRNIENPRPLTHDLIRNILNGLEVGLERIVVTDLKNNTFLAKLVISQNGTEVEIDARPSDSIALAITMNSPIYVNERVLDKVKNV